MEFGNVLSEAGETYDAAVLIPFEGDTYDVAILPRFVVFGLHTAGEVNRPVFSHQHGLYGVVGVGAVFGMYDVYILLERQRLIAGIIIDGVVV